jgi:diguanylate cyclase (GGDEF)-like protein
LTPTSPTATPSSTRRPHSTPSLRSLGAILGRSPFAPSTGLLNNAEVVVWQSSRRLVIAVTIGVVAVGMRLTGAMNRPIWPILAIVPAYLAIVALLTVMIERRRRVSSRALSALALTDVIALFATVWLVTGPAFYPSVLSLSLLALQFTQTSSGRSPVLTIVVGSTVGYVTLLMRSAMHGYPIDWVEEAWIIALYLLVSINGMALQASANRRLTALVDLFASAQRGDFSRPFIEEHDREPDGITLLGRAYNHLRSELATMVLNDSLTGSLNRRGFEHALHQAIMRAMRRRREVALLAIDIDHFKTINDTVGHLAGDTVLRELAELLVHSSRGGDVVGRVGGEEFVVLLPDADSEMAGVVAERIMAAVRQHGFRTVRGRIKVTVSVGIACEPIVDAHVAGALRARADEALYVAKRLGRNRVVMWAPGIRSYATPPRTALAAIV